MSIPTKTPIGIAWIDEHGILWHRLDFGVRISASAAADTVKALLVRPDDNPASAIQSFLFSTQSPDRPMAIFENEDAAVAWARTFIPST
jgi:hypothetical protein